MSELPSEIMLDILSKNERVCLEKYYSQGTDKAEEAVNRISNDRVAYVKCVLIKLSRKIR